ncbi:dephospho-CoA kinase [Halolactibacillus halophilus]|uniref:Dephospho-CoA kinase n=1 Tax=Halolactibacillus halophilus TaxID=306540 RepID=A0A1I5L4D5_9BACI|nr:dephospho-CoA kinase [Halolactibacillus halophilus]GEM00646.1 dephospho-CoA kinase [Halolactibacillus halophilus]SFO92134.1 dephospho-CoA kinase [Halolactibacillus halophilus]
MSCVVGLSGSIATGKSTVVEWFKTKQVPVIDADRIAREIVEPGKPILTRLKQTFGEEIIQTDGSLDRTLLGQMIFNDDTLRQKLDDLMHPAIVKEIVSRRDRYMNQSEPLIILDIPLLFEGGFTNLVDRIIVVYTTEAVQLERLMKRNKLTRQEAKKRIKTQWSIEMKKDLATDVINNNGSLDETYKQCDTLYKKYLSQERKQ